MLAPIEKIKVHSKKKSTGAHYTPVGLAQFLARRLVDLVANNSEALTIMDPACGDGELLKALATELPEEISNSSQFIGFDQDSDAITNLNDGWNTENLNARVEDFLSLSFNHSSVPNMFEDESNVQALADVIIANPPYVRTQVLGAIKAQQLATAFDLTGRVDLYHAFLVAMTNALRPGGILGVITSNRFLSTRGGTSIRQFLESNYDILEVIDLGDTKLFEAAVLPAIFIGRKRMKKEVQSSVKSKFIRIYEDPKSKSTKKKKSIYEILNSEINGSYAVADHTYKLVTGSLTLNDPSEPWKLICRKEESWLSKVESKAQYSLGSLMKIKVGVKTTADSIFIRKDWTTLPHELQPEPELLRSIIDSSDCKRWQTDLNKSSEKILYPYVSIDGKKQLLDLANYPKTRSYFEHHKKRLSSRKYIQESNREWYEIWVPHNPSYWDQVMLVTPDISATPKFFFTSEHSIVNGNCYWLTLRQGLPNDYLFLILGIVNSRLMTQYHDLAFNNKLYSGRRRYLTQYIEKYPIPNIKNPHATELIELVKERVFGVLNIDSQIHLEGKIENAVCKLYGVED